MSLPVVLRPEARAEFDEAFDWYEQQRPGLGVDFVTQVQEAFDRIGATPERYAQIFRDMPYRSAALSVLDLLYGRVAASSSAGGLPQ